MECKCFLVRLSREAVIVALLGITAPNVISCFVDMVCVMRLANPGNRSTGSSGL